MTKDERKLLKALNSLPFVTGFQVKAAYILLQINGLDNALQYVKALRQEHQNCCPVSSRSSK